MDRKVFGIGCPRTGTTSLGRCFSILGFRNASWNEDLFTRALQGDIEPALQFAAAHDSFDDLPWCMLYAELDRRFPGSKFVLTVRKDTQTWLKSFQGHHARWLGHLIDDEGRARDGSTVPVWPDGIPGYERHNDAVRAYFRDRPDDLLEISWERGDGWEKLCRFLRVPEPGVPLPHENRTDARDAGLTEELLRFEERLVPGLRGTARLARPVLLRLLRCVRGRRK